MAAFMSATLTGTLGFRIMPLLGKKTMEAEILKEAVEIARSRKWIAHSPLLPGDDQ
jgi:hypothetical protein